jgi:hypothetical protein
MEFFSVFRFFGWPEIKTNGKTQKLSSKHVTGGKQAEEQEFSLKKSKFQQTNSLSTHRI